LSCQLLTSKVPGVTESQIELPMINDERITTYGLIVEAYARLQGASVVSLKQHCGITGATFELLLRLARSPNGQLTMSELAGQLAITTGGVTRLVDRVIDAGFVERQPCPTDRRVQWVGLTASGRAKIEAATVVHVEDLQRELFDRLTPTDVKHLRGVMNKLRQPSPG